MKLRNYGIVMLSMLILIGSCLTVAATSITDGTGDIWHWAQAISGTGWSWQGNVGNKPNIDIKEVSYTVNENKITLKMEVAGSIQTSDKVIYWVYYNSTDTTYWLSYTNGEGGGFGMKGVMNITSADNVTISGDTLSVELDALGDTSKVELWGYAVEYTTTAADETSEWWGDWVPNEKFPHYGETDGTDDTDDTDGTDDSDGTLDDNDDGSETKTPGFELVVVLAAVAVAFILFRKRR
jgi:hypothetical protein